MEQLGVGPSAELAALHLAILRSDQPRPSGQPGPVSTNLRAELTSFVGRDAELTQVAGLLGAHRLTTLTGPGGAGKTRLAVEAARAELGSMPDGVWLVEFAPVTDPAEVAPTVLATLGIREQALIRGGRPAAAPSRPADPVARLVAALSGKQALLVLDNCEHLVAAVATLADQILGACPRLRIMTTSREPLNITGEALWPVRPLAMPQVQAGADPAAITCSAPSSWCGCSACQRIRTTCMRRSAARSPPRTRRPRSDWLAPSAGTGGCGHKAEGTELAGEALGLAGEVPDEQRAVAYSVGALLAIDGARDQRIARSWFRAAADLTGRMPTLDNPILRLIGPLRTIFEMAETGGKPVPADVLDAVVNDQDPWLRATARLIRGHVGLNFGRQHAAAEADFLAALDIYRALGERWGTAFSLVSLAILEAWRGESGSAATRYEQALLLASELGTMEDVVQFRAQLARELWRLGRRDQARAALAQAERDAHRAGLPELRASVALVAGDLARLDGELDLARGQLAVAADLAGQLSNTPQFRALIASAAGYLKTAEGDLDAARRQHHAALATAISSSARAALGETGYEAACRRGESCTMATVADLAALPTPGA